jgi:hypothetical protein
MKQFIDAVKCMVKSLADLFQKIYVYLFPKQYNSVGEYSYADIQNILIFNGFTGIPNIQIMDTKYKPYSMTDFKYWVEKDRTDAVLYEADFFDCNTFAFVFFASTKKVLKGCPVGIVFVQSEKINHALNFFIDENRKIMLYEPQNDTIFEKPADWNIYFLVI